MVHFSSDHIGAIVTLCSRFCESASVGLKHGGKHCSVVLPLENKIIE